MTRTALSDRQVQVLRAIADGRTHGQIARDLYLTRETVKTHTRRLCQKLGVPDKTHVAALVAEVGIERLGEGA